MASKKKRPAARPSVITSKAELSRVFNVSRKSVDQWCNKPGFPGGRVGPWRRADVEAYLASTKSPAAAVNGSAAAAHDQQAAEISRGLAISRLQRERELAWRVKFENDRIKGQYIDRVEVEAWAATALAEVRDVSMPLAELLAQIVPLELRDVVREEADRCVREMLTMLHRRLKALPDASA